VQQDHLADIFLPALERILNKYSKKIEVDFWGMKPKGIAASPNVHVNRYIGNYDRFLRNFSKAGYDIGLAPMQDDLFHRSKTNNKFREYGACGIAGIYSNIDVYSSCVVDEETGLLVSNSSDSWFEAAARLIENPELRGEIGKQSKEYVRLHYSQKIFEELFWRQIQQIISDNFSHKSSLEQLAGNSKSRGKAMISAHSINGGMGTNLKHQIRTFRNRMKNISNHQFSTFFWLISRYLFDHWAVFKLRLMTSPIGDIFHSNRNNV
jgi:hypothetical protein